MTTRPVRRGRWDENAPYLSSVSRDCGCAYDRYVGGQRRFTRRCAQHIPMCRNLEQWELED